MTRPYDYHLTFVFMKDSPGIQESSKINVVVVAVWWLLVLVVGRLSVDWSMFVERCCH